MNLMYAVQTSTIEHGGTDWGGDAVSRRPVLHRQLIVHLSSVGGLNIAHPDVASRHVRVSHYRIIDEYKENNPHYI